MIEVDESKATHVLIPLGTWRSAFQLLQALPYREVGPTMNALMATTRCFREEPEPAREPEPQPEG